MARQPFSNEQLVQAVANEMDGAIKLLEELVSRNSVVGEELRAQEFVAETLIELGFSVDRILIPESISDDPFAGVPSKSYAGRFNVLGTTPRDGEPTLLLNGHIDVVPVNPSTWATDPFVPVVQDGWLFGRGAGDMKGGFAMAFLALKALRNLDPRIVGKNLSFLSVIEEECTGNGTLAAIRQGVVADAVVLPEPTGLKLLLGGIPITWVKVTIGFGGGHAESSNRVASPADVVAQIIMSLKELETRYNQSPNPPFDTLGHPYNVNVGVIRLGEWPSSVPAELELELRVGHPDQVSDEDVVADVSSLVSRVLGDDAVPNVQVRSHGFRAQGYSMSSNDVLVEAISEAHASLHGVAPGTEVLGSTTDARYYLNQLGIPALCFGPVVRNMHGSNEAVNLSSIETGAATLARFIASYLLGGGLRGFQEGRW